MSAKVLLFLNRRLVLGTCRDGSRTLQERTKPSSSTAVPAKAGQGQEQIVDGPRAGNRARLYARFPTASPPTTSKCRAERQKPPPEARISMDLQKVER